jgi:hypothetical protein
MWHGSLPPEGYHQQVAGLNERAARIHFARDLAQERHRLTVRVARLRVQGDARPVFARAADDAYHGRRDNNAVPVNSKSTLAALRN